MGARQKVLLVVLVLSAVGPALAQDKRAAREKEALRKAQQQLQQVSQEKNSLLEKLTQSETAKDAASKELSIAQVRTRSQANKVKQLELQLEAASAENRQLLGLKNELEQRVVATSSSLAKAESELAQSQQQGRILVTTLAQRNREANACELKNNEIHALGRNLIEQCRDRSATDTLLRLEPFSGLGRVGLESMLEEQRDKLDAQKVTASDPVSP